ncbi:MAG: hypothetical protein LUF34_03015, partial [Lachnospiraceae bacterium]|nr:hypothetical protein [Lachnospiraceae bacterium]
FGQYIGQNERISNVVRIAKAPWRVAIRVSKRQNTFCRLHHILRNSSENLKKHRDFVDRTGGKCYDERNMFVTFFRLLRFRIDRS